MAPEKFLVPDEEARLREHLRDQEAVARARGRVLQLRDAVLGQALLGLGLRISEAVSLQIEDVILDGARRYVRVVRGKRNKVRDVTVGPELRRVLRDFIGHREQGPLFATGRGARSMSRCAGWRAWKKHLRACGLDLPGRGAHVARHSRAVGLYRATKDLRLVARELGHEDIGLTAKWYANVTADDRRDAADLVDASYEKMLAEHAQTATTVAGSATKPRRGRGNLRRNADSVARRVPCPH